MRRPLAFFFALFLPACGSGGGAADDDGVPAIDAGDGQPADSFHIVTSDVVIAAGDERTHCYYTTVPVDREIGVKHWASVMSPGSHHMIM